jgi:hypothetical protein
MRKLACFISLSALVSSSAALAQESRSSAGGAINDALGRIIGGGNAPRDDNYQHGYQEGYEQGRQAQQPPPAPAQQPPPAPYAGSPYSDQQAYPAAARLNGVVRWANPDSGMAGVDTDRGTVRVRGTPRQIDRLRPGDRVSLPFEDINGTPWIAGRHY